MDGLTKGLKMHTSHVRFSRTVTSASRRRCSVVSAPVARKQTPAMALVQRKAIEKQTHHETIQAA
ncbi:hypothetical protein DI392_18940 [Vibrio albus]|uniref:Uncharacterized protein n=2 Tax=Vibrio albus TaxID=2200953 RepID=A0A2U3B4V0_9VIBR|nr:hypothetical protein [Vibrio albus]PWI31820.1 hypothetical protein DI392_18940 [Vibrio albus]